MTAIVQVPNSTKIFNGTVRAVDHVSFDVEGGRSFTRSYIENSRGVYRVLF